MMIKGQIIGGNFDTLFARKKKDAIIEIGELLVSENLNNNSKMIFQVFDIGYSSQISQQNMEMISGMHLEEGTEIDLMDRHIRQYEIFKVKPLLYMENDKVKVSKKIPNFFSELREIKDEDLKFLDSKDNLFVGKVRSGSRTLNIDVKLPGEEAINHHILITATTGRGKSNLVKTILLKIMNEPFCGVLVLDPHAEYFDSCLSKHSKQENLKYYTPANTNSNSDSIGNLSLLFNIRNLKPKHFIGIFDWTEPQTELMMYAYQRYTNRWIENVVDGTFETEYNGKFHDGTLNVLKRRLSSLLSMRFLKTDGNESIGRFTFDGIFTNSSGENTIKDIINNLNSKKLVVINTKDVSGEVELLISNIIANEILSYAKKDKKEESNKKVPISIVLEEAPRVIGKDAIAKGSNIFGTIAREGRKFGIGLIAITQLPSLIPREVLANMNTKIIMGIEMGPERRAIIESASQDLSKDEQNIASLDKGEAIISSTFTKFAIPISIPLYTELLENKTKKDNYKPSFSGMGE